ncbi:hypothetical protein BH18ACT5_BH18ACT5_19860 [soil metagenome]
MLERRHGVFQVFDLALKFVPPVGRNHHRQRASSLCDQDRVVAKTASAQAEHGEQSCIHTPLLFRSDTTGQVPEATYVNRSDLFN